MSADLTSQKIKDTFGSLLITDPAAGGLSASLIQVYDGDGTASAFYISTGSVGIDNIVLDGNTISSTNSNGNLVFDPNGTGWVAIADTHLLLDEIAAPGTPAAGKVAIYAKADGHVYIKDDAGTETDLAGSSLSTTDDLTEGVTNFYYTDERVDDRVAVLIQNNGNISWSYNDGAGTLTPTIADAYLLNNGDVGTGVYDFGGSTSFEIPNGTNPTVNAAGQIALDTDGDGSTITSGVIKVYDGTQTTYVVAANNYPTSDNDVPAYDSATHRVVWQAPTGGLANIVEDLSPQLGADLDANGFDIQFDNATGIYDDSNNEQLLFNSTASAVNYLTLTNSATGNYPTIGTAGSDSTVGLNINFQSGIGGTGLLVLKGAYTANGINFYNGTSRTTNYVQVTTNGPSLTSNVSVFLPTVSGTLLCSGNNLSDVGSASTARTNLGLAIGTNVQAYDATLTAFAAYNTNGILTQTAADTFAGRTITAGSAVAVTNGDGVSGNPTIAVDITGLTADATPDSATDYVLTYDASAAANKKVLLSNLPGGGGGAPTSSQYVTLATDATLTNERVLTGTANQITITDAGAGSTVTLSVPYQFNLGSSATGPSELRLFEDTDNGSNKVTMTVASSIAADATVTVPATTGTLLIDANNLSDVSSASTARTNLGLAIGTNVQAYDATLAALAAYNTNGILTQTAADTFAGRTITGTASEVTVTNGDGVSGNPTLSLPSTLALRTKTVQLQDNNTTISDDLDSTKLLAFQCSGITTGTTRTLTVPNASGTIALTSDLSSYQPLDATLTSLAAYNTNGILTQTAADTFTGRTITGTSNEVDVTNGNGVSGNPTLGLSATIDLSGKTSFKLPTGTGPTVDASGKIAIDTNSDNTNITHGSLVFHDGTSARYNISVDTYPSTDGHALVYDGTLKKYKFAAVTGTFDIGALTEDTLPDLAADYTPTYDASAGSNKKVLMNNFSAAIQAALYPISVGQFFN